MSLFDYFQKVETDKIEGFQFLKEGHIGNQIDLNPSSIEEYDIVFFDIEEERGSIRNSGCSKGANQVRGYFYQLYQGLTPLKMADFGTICQGESVTDTYFAVTDVISQLLRKNVMPVFLGGSQNLVYANYLAYTKEEQTVNLVSIDSKFGLGKADDPIHDLNYFSKIIIQQPNVLFNYSNLGYQTYLVDQAELHLLEDLFFDSHRLGELKADIKVAEPIIRNADFVNFSMSAVAQPYAPANKVTSANGLNGEQACQLSRYAGMSDKLSSFGIYDFNPTIFDNGQTANLIAQMIWYFIDGYCGRKGDFPACNKREYVKYTVNLEEGERELVFYKSPKSDRWWMNVPYHSSFMKKYERHLMLPCDYNDYVTATKNEIPERWFQTFQKLK
ncbi:formimidoylglutamase [Vicingaceae bacterium]|nr:formimidoylglutamase [Vicingaceae bacterium]MDB4060547.1 formimidoylglutamase [Vicingaceae bacterium]MDC1452599.1 formimidoylglutamase [Vicingaceae bacterium]